jgi:DNA-binding MarR family transcriptional regulator
LGADQEKNKPALQVLARAEQQVTSKDDRMNIHARSYLINADTLDGTTKAILLTLLTYCHGDKDTCYPSLGDMAKISGYVKRTIRNHIRILERLGFIETTKDTARKSNTYRILGLYDIQIHSGTECLQSSNPEGLQENTYGPAGGRFDGKKPPKALIICDLEQSDKIPDQAIVDPATVVENQSQKQAIVRPKAPVAGHQSQNKASVRFEGPLTTQKIVELYNLYTRQGSFKWCYKILAKKISGR